MSTSKGMIENDIGEHIAHSHEIPVPKEECERIAKAAGSGSAGGSEFLYLDCGRWGGNGERYSRQRNFGIVWGRWALLCDFVTDGTSHPARIKSEAGPINALLAALTEPDQTSVRVIKSEYVPPSPLAPEPGWEDIYVFLPDMHLPLVTRMPDPLHDESGAPARRYRADGAPMGRFRFTSSSDDSLSEEHERWFRHYLQSDIFQGAATDLVEFLEKLEGYRGDARLKLVQVGDMYDLWIGLDRHFDVHNDESVVLMDSVNELGLTAQRFIEYWVGRTHEARANSKLIKALLHWQRPGAASAWLYGNHDCYLASHTPGNIAQRRKFLLEGGVFAEHGHRGDSSNRDGAKSGQQLTNEVFEFPFLRKLDPNRRQVFLEVATRLAVETALHSPEKAFCVYVMGHTHSGYLSRVRLSPSSFRVHVNEFWMKNSILGVLDSPFQR